MAEYPGAAYLLAGVTWGRPLRHCVGQAGYEPESCIPFRVGKSRPHATCQADFRPLPLAGASERNGVEAKTVLVKVRPLASVVGPRRA